MKKITLLILTSFLSFSGFSQGATCDIPIVVDPSTTYTISDNTSNYGDDYDRVDRPALGGEQYTNGTGSDYYLTGDDVVYAITPTQDGVFDFDLTETLDDWIGFWLFEGCPFTSIVARHTATSGTTRSLPGIQLTAGITYYVVISTWAAPQSTPYTLTITPITCPAPSTLTASNITINSADLGWVENGSSNTWDIEWGVDGFSPLGIPNIDNTSSNPYNLMGLTPDTAYDFYVRSDCGMDNTSDTSDWVGPFSFSTLPLCPAPSGMTAPIIGSNFAELSWTSGDSEIDWNIEYKASIDFTPGVGEEDLAFAVNTTPVTVLTSLTPNTTYYVYYQANCVGIDLSSWVGPFTFTTACAPVDVYPYNTDFASCPPNACWVEAGSGDPIAGPGDLGTGLWTDGSYTDNGITYDMNYINLYTTNREDWLISESYDLSTGGPYELNYHVRHGNTTSMTSSEPFGSDDYVQLLISTDGGSSWSAIETWDTGNDPDYTGLDYNLDLSAQTGTVKFAFYGTDGTVNDIEDTYFGVSKFQIREIPACADVLGLTIDNFTDTTVDFSWTAGSGETTWEYVIQASGTGIPVGSGISTNSTSVSESGLVSDTSYEIYVRSDCGGGDFGAWIGPVTFYTGYCVPSGTSTSTYIDNFSTSNASSNISNLTSGLSTDNYGDFTAMSVTTSEGSSFDFNIEIVSGTVGCAIWIDWDNDFNFDSSDLQFSTTSYSSGPFSGTITLPATIANGDYRMRVMIDWNDSNPGNDDACGFGSGRGEVEDYIVTIDNTLGLSNLDKSLFVYYPNPVNGILTLKSQKNIENVSVINILGQEVLRVTPNSVYNELDMSVLSNGSYFVRVTLEDVTETVRIIKQ